MAFREAIDRYFGITASGSSFSTEIRGGIVVFMAMIYIITVNSLMMSHAGVDREVAVTTTTVMASLGCALMALYARFPVAMAPTMGVNAFVVYTMVLGSGYTWHEALVAVLISGVAFFLISISGLRGRLITAIPTGLRLGIVTALGLFIVFVGLQNSQLIVASDTLVALGDLSDPPVLLAMFCILSTLVFITRWKNMGVLIGMAVSVVIGLVFGILEPPAQLVSMPVTPDFLEFAEGLDAGLLNTEFILMTMSLTLVQFFDTTGTLMGVGLRANKTDKECEKAMKADSAMSIVSGLMGSTPTGSYMESTIGIECGARTGFSSLVVALLFAVALFLGPLFGMIGYSCTVGAMVMVGVAMMTELRSVEWNDSAASCSVLMTVAFTILAYSIATGMCMGVVTYCLVMFASGRRNEIDGFMYILLALCAAYLLMTALT